MVGVFAERILFLHFEQIDNKKKRSDINFKVLEILLEKPLVTLGWYINLYDFLISRSSKDIMRAYRVSFDKRDLSRNPTK